MTTFKHASIAILLVLSCTSAQARAVMTITCDEPNGSRTDFYQGEFRESKDGFAGIKPTFIFNDKKAKTAVMNLEPAAQAKEMGFKASNTLNIMVHTATQITMAAPTQGNLARMYTLFPTKGIGYFTLHRFKDVQDGEASTGTMIAKCTVQRQ